MKKIFVTISAALTVCASAFDLNTVAPGNQFSRDPAAENSRSRLFTDAMPAKSFLEPSRKNQPVDADIIVTPARELVFKCAAGKKSAAFDVMLPVPETKKIRISFSIKADNFFRKAKGDTYNRFFIFAGSACIWLRGNTGDIRIFDGSVKKYVRLTTLANGVWLQVTMDVDCTGEPIFSINGKENIRQRGKCAKIKSVRFSGNFYDIMPDTGVSIKDLKVTALP